MTRRATATIFMAVVLLFAGAPAAWADLVGDVSGGVSDVLGGGDGSSQGSGSEGEPSDSGAGSGGLLGDLTDAVDGDEEEPSESNNDPVKKLFEGVNKTFDGTQDEVEDATSDPSGYVGGIGDTVDKKVKDAKRALKDKVGRDRNSDPSSATLPGSHSPADVYGSHLAAARATDPKDVTRPERSDSDSPTVQTSTPGVFAEIGRVAAEAAEQVAFPLALALMVGGFLMVQNRIDRRDPKLALAPIDSDHELLTFS